ncbi:HU family DNA-binding protein [Oribacterium sp. oral taxon 102]|nr:HU family DNA-binding protein [Oribacterium sp. oral taxon 102]
MNRQDLVAAVARDAELSKKDADAAVKAVFDEIASALAAGDKVQLIGFGTFDTAERAAREGRNPRTGETMMIEASRSPRFKAGKALKDRMN